MCFSHKIKCQVPYEFTFTNALGVLYHYPLHYMYMTWKDIFNLSNNTNSFKVFHNEIWGKISYNPVLPSTAISGSIAQPGKTWFSHLGFPGQSILCQPWWRDRWMDNVKKSILPKHKVSWAASWENQQNDCAPSEDSDQPGHLNG